MISLGGVFHMNPAFSFRPATAADIPQLVRLRLAYLQEEFSDTDIPQSKLDAVAAQLPDYFSAHLGADCFVFTAEIPDGTLAANVILCTQEKPANLSFPSGKSGVVLGVYTMPEYRGQGICTKLMEMLLAQAKAEGVDIVRLSASHMGKPVYEKLGFTLSHSKFTEMEYTISTK